MAATPLLDQIAGVGASICDDPNMTGEALLAELLACIDKDVIITALGVEAPLVETTRFCLAVTEGEIVTPDDNFPETMSVAGQPEVEIPVAWNGWTTEERADWIAAQAPGLTSEDGRVYSDTSFGIRVSGGSATGAEPPAPQFTLFKYIRLAMQTTFQGRDCTAALDCFGELFGGCSLVDMITATQYPVTDELNKEALAEVIQSEGA